jgi:tagatose 1,6-diphosphate aldolase
MFKFLDFDYLTDGEITLLISEKAPADIGRGYVPAYKYTIIVGGFPAGKCDIRIGGGDNTYFGGHIGYEVFPAFRGNHYAEKACRLLLKVAVAHGMNSLYISCNPDNAPSRKTCEALGAKLLCIADLPEGSEMYLLGERRKCIYEWEI